VRKNLDSGKATIDISLVVREALETYLEDILDGNFNNQRKSTIPLEEIARDEMIQKGFYLTESLVDAIKTYAYFNKVNDSYVVRNAIASYLNR
jgi:hypothetical protein